MPRLAPLAFQSSFSSGQTFHSIDLKFPSDEKLELQAEHFLLLNELFPNSTEHPLSITLRFQNFLSFHARTATFARLFQGRRAPYSRLTLELHPLKAKSIRFDPKTFDRLQVHELSIYADSLSSSFEAIFDNTNITHLNIEGATVNHDPALQSTFHGQIQSLKMTRMIDTVNSDEFPPFPVQALIIEAHKMRTLDAESFVHYPQLTGLNLIQPDVSITPKIFQGLEKLSNLRSLSLDAERIANGALKHVQHIQTLVLGSYLKLIDSDSLNALQDLRQLDVRYVQFATLQGNSSCLLADFINRRRMLGLTVYLPAENVDCDCILVFLNTMIDEGDQAGRCQSLNNDRCLFSSCSIVSEYFTRKQKENEPIKVETPPANTPAIEVNEPDSPFYPDSKEDSSTTIRIAMEANIYDEVEEEQQLDMNTTTTSTTEEPVVTHLSTPLMKRLHSEPKSFGSANYLIVSWIPFAIIASCLFLSLIVAMISYMIYHQRRTVSFKLVPQTASII